MIGQSLYYLNNKKYITNTTNIQTVVAELNSFYHNKDPRKIFVVHPGPSLEGAQLATVEYVELANAIRDGASTYLNFIQWDEASSIDFIQNSEKAIIVYTHESEMLNVYVRYIAGLLRASNFYTDPSYDVNAIAVDFVNTVIETDTILTLMRDSDTMADARAHCEAVLADPEFPDYGVVFENGKNFSYDLLFFLNEKYPCVDVRSLLIEKFTIHSAEIAKDVIQQFTAQRRDLGYICAVIDWMNENATPENGYATDKKQFLKDVYVDAANTGNYSVAIYKLIDLWNKVKDDPNFKAAHTSKTDTIDGWEYNDQYNEINHLLPTVKKVLERNWDINNLSEEIKLLDTDVQFFAKRQNRIPYLIHKYKL